MRNRGTRVIAARDNYPTRPNPSPPFTSITRTRHYPGFVLPDPARTRHLRFRFLPGPTRTRHTQFRFLPDPALPARHISGDCSRSCAPWPRQVQILRPVARGRDHASRPWPGSRFRVRKNRFGLTIRQCESNVSSNYRSMRVRCESDVCPMFVRYNFDVRSM